MTLCSKAEAAQIVANQLADAANNKTVLLLSGGSSAAVGVRALNLLHVDLQHNITVLLADERFVAYDSTDSNATLLKELGIARAQVGFIEVIRPQTLSRQDTAALYWENLQRSLTNAAHVIAVLGIGTDNHTAGILPSSAAAESQSEGVVDYSTDVFERITIAPNFFKNIDYAFVYAEGEDKEAAVQAIEDTHNVVTHPSQLVKNTKEWQLLFNREKI